MVLEFDFWFYAGLAMFTGLFSNRLMVYDRLCGFSVCRFMVIEVLKLEAFFFE